MVMIYRIQDVFDYIGGNQGIYEEFIYQHLKTEGTEYKVLSSALSEDTEMGYVKLTATEEKEYKTFANQYGIHVARLGNGGKMKLLSKNFYLTSDKAYILYLKSSFVKENSIRNEKEFLEWFILKYQNYVFSFASQTDNATWNKTNFFKYGKIEINFDNISSELGKLIDFDNINKLNSKYIASIEHFYKKPIILNVGKKEYPIANFLNYVSRNDCLSEEGIYLMQAGFKEDSEKIAVISGNSVAKIYGYVPISSDLHYLKDKSCLVCVTRGNAGKLTFLPKGVYATNTNAMILYIKSEVLNTLNIANEEEEECYLRFLKLCLQAKFTNYASSSDLSVFPMSKAVEDISMHFPKFNQEVMEIAKIDLELEKIKSLLGTLQSKAKLL